MIDAGITPLKVPKPKNFLPKPYAIGENIAHKENIRPVAQAIGLALNQDEQYGGIKPALSMGPEGRPNITRRLAMRAPKSGFKEPHISLGRKI